MYVGTNLVKQREAPPLYVDYANEKQVRALDQNNYPAAEATVFPYGLYVGEPQPVADYLCGEREARSLDSHYIIDREVAQHPARFSRFGYARAFYGYPTGHFLGRYRENNYCQQFELPQDMAPARFYRAPHIGAFSVASEAYAGARTARG